MADVRAMFDSQWVGAWDLAGKDRTLEISGVKAAQITSQRGTNKKPIVSFKGAKKQLILNKTMMRVVAAMYGFDTAAWIGKPVTLYATTTDVGGKTVDCVRIRPGVPKKKAEDLPEVAVDTEMRSKQDAAFGRNGGAVDDPYASDEDRAAAIDRGEV